MSTKSKIVILQISASKLAALSDRLTDKSPPTVKLHVPGDRSSEANGTPTIDAANGDGDAAKSESKKKKGASSTGRKRAPPAIDPNGPMKERARPGPKKKPRIANGEADGVDGDSSKAAPAVPAHKLGPKANTGAINAGLRALDRSGKPCRRWEKKGLNIKSFTGTAWGVSTWKAPSRDSFSGDVKSDSSTSIPSDAKPHQESSAVPSERSHADGGDTLMTNALDSSPAPAPIAA